VKNIRHIAFDIKLYLFLFDVNFYNISIAPISAYGCSCRAVHMVHSVSRKNQYLFSCWGAMR